MEDEQPAPEDYVKTPCGNIGQHICVGQVEGKFLGEFANHEIANIAICGKMNKERFWPSVWWESDHGNVSVDMGFRCKDLKAVKRVY